MRHILAAAALVSAPLFHVPAGAQAPTTSANIEASRLHESGPAVVGGTGATVGPNSRNQAITPMPGLPRQDEEVLISEKPPVTMPPPVVRPVTPPPKR
ncbi:hypothetical protein [Reyranella sp.]|uniref:hypothetical protein n=1 Tax=Reyranella sp. TaxID=1929291 RepID=UPI003BAD6FFE